MHVGMVCEQESRSHFSLNSSHVRSKEGDILLRWNLLVTKFCVCTCCTHIHRDLQTIYMDPPPGICVVPSGDDLTRVRMISGIEIAVAHLTGQVSIF